MCRIDLNGRSVRKVALTLTVTVALYASLLAASMAASAQQEQSRAATDAPSTSAFDVASVKPVNLRFNRPFDSIEQLGWKSTYRYSERISARDAPLRGLIQMAYDVWAHQIVGLPGWADSARYEIDARSSGAQHEQMRPMMRTLLVDRFKLVVHRETRTLPILTLVRADGDLKIAPMPEGGCFKRGEKPIPFSPPPAPMPNVCGSYRRIVVTSAPVLVERVEAVGVSMSHLANLLSAERGQIVIDGTNFTDTFSYAVSFSPNLTVDIPGAALGREIGGAIDVTSAPSFSQAIKEQLGLELKPSTGAVEVVVVDRIERPTPN